MEYKFVSYVSAYQTKTDTRNTNTQAYSLTQCQVSAHTHEALLKAMEEMNSDSVSE